MKIDVTIVDPDDVFDEASREFGEPTPGPWLRLTCDDPFLDYKVCVGGEGCAEALGLRIASWVGEALRPVFPTVEETEA